MAEVCYSKVIIVLYCPSTVSVVFLWDDFHQCVYGGRVGICPAAFEIRE